MSPITDCRAIFGAASCGRGGAGRLAVCVVPPRPKPPAIRFYKVGAPGERSPQPDPGRISGSHVFFLCVSFVMYVKFACYAGCLCP